LARPIITLTTDFGSNDHFVGVMKGVILDIVPEAQIVDICHSVQPFDVLDGALTISQAYSYFPTRTVHVVVVDPGVGTARRPILASSDGYHFVAPDNGVLFAGLRGARTACTCGTYRRALFSTAGEQHLPRTRYFFSGRAYLAKEVEALKFGEEVQDTSLSAPNRKLWMRTVARVVLKVDRFGNIITNITPQDAPMLFRSRGQRIQDCRGSREITEIRSAYADGAPGEVIGILAAWVFWKLPPIAERRPN